MIARPARPSPGRLVGAVSPPPGTQAGQPAPASSCRAPLSRSGDSRRSSSLISALSSRTAAGSAAARSWAWARLSCAARSCSRSLAFSSVSRALRWT